MLVKLLILASCLLFVTGRELRGLFDCRKLSETCDGIPRCCGGAQCYWANGYSMIKDGVCVDCIKADQKCQRDGQCCNGLVCDKYSWHNVDGECKAKREAGPCYKDDQCVTDCKKSGINIYGTCQ